MTEIKQNYIESFCPIDNKKVLFVSTLNPTGFYVCCDCGCRIKENEVENGEADNN